jgi:hypothetical protein
MIAAPAREAEIAAQNIMAAGTISFAVLNFELDLITMAILHSSDSTHSIILRSVPSSPD